jgi:hypothetical protein
LQNHKFQVWFGLVVSLTFLSLLGCGGSSHSNSVQQPTGISIAGPPPSVIGVGANWRYTATVSGSDNQAVTWSAAGAGTIDSATGLYVAPNTVPNPAMVTITATSQADSSLVASTTVTIQQTDPLGTVSSFTQFPNCPQGGGSGSVGGGTCFQLAVSCPGVSDFSAYLKVNLPSGAPVGTVLFGVGTGGSGLYDDPTASGYDFGGQVVSSLLASGYNTVQVSFGAPFDNMTTPHGWLTGPGGVRRLACRYATVADWVFNHPSTINAGVSAGTSAPMCATGNSGGSAAIAYAVYEYGLDTEFAMIEPTSGPVMTRIDLGCSPASVSGTGPVCSSSSNNSSMSYEIEDADIIDEAYQSAGSSTPTLCSSSLSGNPAPDAATLFLSDSIIFDPTTKPSFPNTVVKQLFGDLDSSNAVPQGMTWTESIVPSPASPVPIAQCLPGVSHDVPSDMGAAVQIASDISAACH